MGPGPMVHLVSVQHPFHAKVIAARLGSDGILTQLRGAVDGPYPLVGEVGVWVEAEDLAVARELLLCDEVESAFDHGPEGVADRLSAAPAWVLVVAVVLAASSVWLVKAAVALQP